jgi:ethanolamine utilization protein EutQ (cupin superfamily)
LLTKNFLLLGLGGADDVIVVDLKHFNHVSVDKTTGMATVGPGNLLEGLVEGLNNAGRFMPHGSSPTVGVGGETLIVLDGVFEMLDGAGNKSVAKKGDVYFFPAGSMVTFSTSQEVLAFYTVQRARK